MPIRPRWLGPWLMKAGVSVAVMLGLWLYIGHVERSARREQMAADAARTVQAALQARINAHDQARAEEAAHARGTKEANDALLPELHDARARLAVHLAWLRGETDQGGTRQAGLPATIAATGITDRSDRDALVAEDLQRCTDAVTRLVNAKRWAEKELVQ